MNPKPCFVSKRETTQALISINPAEVQVNPENVYSPAIEPENNITAPEKRLLIRL